MLRLVEITQAETGWKGDWYKPGQRHWVSQQPNWPKVYVNRWLKAEQGPRVCGINEADCKTVVGPWHPRAWLRTLLFNLGF